MTASMSARGAALLGVTSIWNTSPAESLDLMFRQANTRKKVQEGQAGLAISHRGLETRVAQAYLPSAAFRVVPMSAGLLATRMPAPSSAAILSSAFPEPPEMMAPACPIRLPGGAVWPAMKAAMGLVNLPEALNSAACSS